MKNLVQDGKTLKVTAAADTTAGSLVIVSDTVGVAFNTCKAGETLILSVDLVYDLPKATGAINPGVKVYWSAANSNVTTTASGNTLIGRCWASAALASDATTIPVKLTPAV